MSARLGATLALALLGVSGCVGEAEPRPEWLVQISTDAPVPQLGDRLVVETLNEDGELACDGCRRVLAAGHADDLPISFSIVPNGEALLLRTRLFRARVTGSDGLPEGQQLIDHLASLPQTNGRQQLAVSLSLGCFGVAADVRARRACSPASGRLAAIGQLAEGPALVTGSSGLAETRGCRLNTPDGMTCIAGGVFVRGDHRATPLNQYVSANRERLVKLSPYFLDEDELSVGQVRALLERGLLDQAPVPRGEPDELSAACTFLGVADASNDDYPINCVSATFAEQACAAQGKRLPTEAEWEYAAGSRELETDFPWGSDPNICQYAVIGRSPFNLGSAYEQGATSCVGVAGIDALTGPVALGESLDVTRQGIRNLGGNLSELVADAFGSYAAACWGDAVMLDNPRCDVSDLPEFPVALRGGYWHGHFLNVPSAARSASREIGRGSAGLGFRCAQDAE